MSIRRSMLLQILMVLISACGGGSEDVVGFFTGQPDPFANILGVETDNAYAGMFRENTANTPDSVLPSSIPGMQWESILVREPQRQWAESLIGNPMLRAVSDTGPIEAQFGLIFSVLVPNDWVVTDDLTKIHSLHSSLTGESIYEIYIKGDEYYFLSAEDSYTAPIDFGVEQMFHVRCRMAYQGSDPQGWVEGFLDQQPTGSSQPLPGQFVPRHTVSIPDSDVNGYLVIGLDTVEGMREEVSFRQLFWSLKYLSY